MKRYLKIWFCGPRSRPFYLRVTHDDDHERVLIGIEVGADGDEVTGPGFTERRRVIDKTTIRRQQECEMSNKYAKLVPMVPQPRQPSDEPEVAEGNPNRHLAEQTARRREMAAALRPFVQEATKYDRKPRTTPNVLSRFHIGAFRKAAALLASDAAKLALARLSRLEGIEQAALEWQKCWKAYYGIEANGEPVPAYALHKQLEEAEARLDGVLAAEGKEGDESVQNGGR